MVAAQPAVQTKTVVQGLPPSNPIHPLPARASAPTRLNQPGCYRDVTDTTIVAQFKTIEDSLPDFLKGLGELFVPAWTTTPWTLPSNTALTVGPNIDYSVIKTYNQYTFAPITIVLASALVEKQLGNKYTPAADEAGLKHLPKRDKTIPYFVVTSCKGKDLTGIRYEQLLPYALPYQNPENAFRVIEGSFVTTEDGTGVVHTAPYLWCRWCPGSQRS